MTHTELIARLRLIAGKGMADYFNSGHPNSNAITEAADAIEALEASQERNTKYTLALQDDALKLQTEVERLTTLYVEGDGTVSAFGPKTDANVEIRKCRDAIRALIKEIPE